MKGLNEWRSTVTVTGIEGFFVCFRIFHLYNINNKSWKKKSDPKFDITLWTDGNAMNFCELNIRYKRSFKEKYDPNTRLYRYLEIFLEQTKKKLKDFQNLFKEKGLAIVVQCNLKIENYINITLNLSNVAYGLYRKPSKEINPF